MQICFLCIIYMDNRIQMCVFYHRIWTALVQNFLFLFKGQLQSALAIVNRDNSHPSYDLDGN